MSQQSVPLDLPALQRAAEKIGGAVLRTLQWQNDVLSNLFDATVFLKMENLQRTGSFKIRGASHKLLRLRETEPQLAGVIAASAGNHAQGVARAAMQHKLPATVVMPQSAPLTKIEACKALHANIVLHGDNLEEAWEEALRLAAEAKLALIHPYDDWDIIAGQASVGLEMLEDCPNMTTAIVPLGGGGLISGIGLALKLQRPNIRIIGVQTEAVAPWRHYLSHGVVEAPPASAHTIADGIKVKRAGMLTRQTIARYVDEIVTVDDNAIAEAIVTLLERTRTIGEGAGVVGLAALMSGKIHVAPGEQVVVVVSGGNIDMTLVGRSIDYGLASSGRLMSIAVTIADAPGQLAGLLGIVAGHGMNVRHVEHRRGELHIAVGMTEVIMQIETRDFDHQAELLAHFSQQGLAARNLILAEAAH